MGDKQEKTREAVRDTKTIAGKVESHATAREKALQDIFDDNTTGRPQDPDGRD